MRKISLFLTFLSLVSSVVFAQGDTTVTVFAASSLTDAFTELEAAFEDANPGVDVVVSFAGSSTLAAQLAEGAPTDVFASANPQQMLATMESGRVGETAYLLVRNQLVVALPADNPGRIETLQDLATPGLLIAVAAPEVPVRVYTDEALAVLSQNPDYASDFQDAVMTNVVTEEPNVRSVAAKVALGEVDAGFVYGSDITPELAESVTMLSLPDGVSPTAEYAIAPVADSNQPDLAAAFVAFALSETGQNVLVEWGFLPACEPEITVTTLVDGALEVEATPEASPVDNLALTVQCLTQ